MTVVAHLLLLCILAFFLLLFLLPCVVTFRAIQILIFLVIRRGTQTL